MDIDGGAYLWTLGSLGSSCNLFLRLEFNCIYLVELFAINCGPGLHMRCGVAVSQLEPAFSGILSGPMLAQDWIFNNSI